MVMDAYKKIKDTNIQRYYILSTVHCDEEEKIKIDNIIEQIRIEHGCQIIVNGVFDTLKYYLRLINSTDNFINNYVKNLSQDTEINFEHKIAWNRIITESKYSTELEDDNILMVAEDSEEYKIK